MSNFKTDPSLEPAVQYNGQLTASEVNLYGPATGESWVGDVWLTNVSGTPTATISLVKSGGSADVTNRIFSRAMAANESVKLSGIKLNAGSFISGIGTASSVAVVVDGTVSSGGTSGGLTGIQTDAIGTGGHGAGTVTGTNAVGTGANRYLFGALLVQPNTFVTTYDTLTMTCNDGTGALAMTALGNCPFNYGSGAIGAVYLFGRANPTSGSTQTLTGTAVKSGVTMATVLGSVSKSGVASVTTAATDGPTTVSALSLAITSAAGHVPMFAGAFRDPPQDFNLRTKYFNGVLNAGATVPQWLLMADALGAATVTATTSNTSYHAAVGIDVVPA